MATFKGYAPPSKPMAAPPSKPTAKPNMSGRSPGGAMAPSKVASTVSTLKAEGTRPNQYFSAKFKNGGAIKKAGKK